MNFDELNKIIDKFNQTDVRELNIDDGDFHLHLSKNEASAAQPVQNVAPVAPVNEADTVSEKHQGGASQIVSPMVGTVYLQPEPGADKYVEPGQTVHEGDVVCIIEAMKMLTEVKSNVTGKINQVLVENEDLVEFDQPLFEIEEA